MQELIWKELTFLGANTDTSHETVIDDLDVFWNKSVTFGMNSARLGAPG